MSKEFGDFQTPFPLVDAVLNCLTINGKSWSRALEPTCGRGNFIEGLLKLATPPREVQAIEIQADHFETAKRLIACSSSNQMAVKHANIFDLNLRRDLQWSERGPLLVVGNPPWVTNAELGRLGSENLPQKRNIKGLRGIEARTGQSNFDIAEYIWLKLIQELALEQPTIALLCKTSVARNVLQAAFDSNLPITSASIRMIDAKKWFGATVEACLFCVEVGLAERRYEAAVYENLFAVEPLYTTGIIKKRLVADMSKYSSVASVDGVCPLTWRQGLKHDAASVMELSYDESGRLCNKCGEIVNVEQEYVYPLLKSSDVFHGMNNRPKKAVIVTQKWLGQDTSLLKWAVPQLWNYLLSHIEVFERRKSSIYEKQPLFAIFGIGDYAFAPYKVAISGFHKVPKFRAIGPVDGRPVMLDDTCYFIPCSKAKEAAFLTSLLNDPECLNLINSMAFLDAKRPITKKLLQRINLITLFEIVEKQAVLIRANQELAQLEGELRQAKLTWPSSMEEFLAEYFQNAGYTSSLEKDGSTRQLTLMME